MLRNKREKEKAKKKKQKKKTRLKNRFFDLAETEKFYRIFGIYNVKLAGEIP